jgi:small subunit ribosomal protein S16
MLERLRPKRTIQSLTRPGLASPALLELRRRISFRRGVEFDCRPTAWQARIDRFRRTDLVLTIRLSRIGKKKKPFYRVVVIERTRPRDGRVKEAVGTYDPLKKPAEIRLDAERVKYWLGLGAQPSDTVRSFLKLQKIA